MEETGFGGHKGHRLSSSSHLCSVALDRPGLEPQLKVVNYSAQVTITGIQWPQCPGYDMQEGVTATDCTRPGTHRGQGLCGGCAAAFLARGLSLSKPPLCMCLLNTGLGEGRPGACRAARHQPSCRNTMVWLTRASRLGFPEPFCKGSGRSKEKGTARAIPTFRPHSQLSRQRQTLTSSVWEGGRSCFHFISYSSCTVSHRREKPQEMHSSSPSEAFQKQGARKNIGENTLDFRGETKPHHQPRGQQRGKIKKEAWLLAGFMTLSKWQILWVSIFFPICQMEIIKAVLKLEWDNQRVNGSGKYNTLYGNIRCYYPLTLPASPANSDVW